MDVITLLALLVAVVLGAALGVLAGASWQRARAADTAAGAAAAALEQARASDAEAVRGKALEAAGERAVVKEGLASLQRQLQSLHEQKVEWQAQLQQQVSDVRLAADALRRETGSLATALRRPQVRGRWGELHLRRAVELAGLVDRCDFDEQASVRDADAALRRPDLVVNLAGGKQVVVDAKVPLDAFLDALECEESARAGHLDRHCRQLRQHVDGLAAKAYWRSLPASPEFVVLFVPSESFLSAALEADGSLLEYAASRKVVLATPTTLIALLRTVAHAWTQAALAEQAAEIHRLGRDLHERLGTFGGHLDKLGRSLGASVEAYNKAVGSLETRVLVAARRFTDLAVTDAELKPLAAVESVPRLPSAAELVEDARSGALGGPAVTGVAGERSA